MLVATEVEAGVRVGGSYVYTGPVPNGSGLKTGPVQSLIFIVFCLHRTVLELIRSGLEWFRFRSHVSNLF